MSSGANSVEDNGAPSSKKSVNTSDILTIPPKKPNTFQLSNGRVSNTIIPLNNLRLCRSDSEEYSSDSENSPESENIVEPQGCVEFDSDSSEDSITKPEIDDDIYGMDGAPIVPASSDEENSCKEE